jgi:hypothetical protein
MKLCFLVLSAWYVWFQYFGSNNVKFTLKWIAENNGRSYEFKGQNEGEGNKGMILPFLPLTMTFHNVNYFVDMPKVIQLKTFIYLSIYMFIVAVPLLRQYFYIGNKSKGCTWEKTTVAVWSKWGI